MRNHSCWFQSIEDPKYKYDIGEILYRCPNTGSLLEVEHNVEELKKDSSGYCATGRGREGEARGEGQAGAPHRGG